MRSIADNCIHLFLTEIGVWCDLYFLDLHTRLIEIARERVRSGEMSERGLARLCDMSQPHLHNVLKNIRALSPASADRLMRGLNIGITELIWRRPGDIQLGVTAIPILRGRLGPGADAEFGVYLGCYPLPVSLVGGVIDPVLARLSPDLTLPIAFERNDLVLLDRNPGPRADPDGSGCWVVQEEAGLRVRYVKRRGMAVFLANEATLQHPERWLPLKPPGGNILDVVRARIVWISREMET